MNEDYYFQKFREDTEEAYTAFSNYVHRPLLMLGKDLLGKDNAEEVQVIVAGALYMAYERRSSFSKIEDVRQWLRRVVRNECIDWLRKKQSSVRYQAAVLSMHNEFRDAMMAQSDLDAQKAYEFLRIRALEEVENLPLQQKKVIKLYLAGYKNKDIAAELGMSPKTAANTKTDAFNNIRKNLDLGPEAFTLLLAMILAANESKVM
jgi:RNA polymerase sigma factor (sigma-70 family)